MPGHDPRISTRQMLDRAREAVQMAGSKDAKALEQDRMLNLALVRLVEIIGEAANRVPKSEQALHAEIPWADIVGARHRLIHGYDKIDAAQLWQIVHADLPRLIEQLAAIPGLPERGA